MKSNIYLIGFMGTGKTTIGCLLAERLAYKMIDLDRGIEKKAGMTVSEIFAQYGEEKFRTLETEFIQSCNKLKNHVIACGGGAVLNRKNVDYMLETGTIVLLTAKPKTILDRVRNNNSRPLLSGNMNLEYVQEMLSKRSKAYEYAARIKVSTDEKSPQSIAEEIIKHIIKN